MSLQYWVSSIGGTYHIMNCGINGQAGVCLPDRHNAQNISAMGKKPVFINKKTKNRDKMKLTSHSGGGV